MEQLPLKDIHLPEPVSWWPPAPGWILIALLLPLLWMAVRYLNKRIRQKSVLKTAGRMLTEIRNDKNRDSLQTLIDLSTLLRRVAISTAPRTDVASLSGQAWLAYLDASLPDAAFSKGVGRCLADAQYRQTAPAETDLEALFKLCEHWLKQQKSTKPLPGSSKDGKLRGKK